MSSPTSPRTTPAQLKGSAAIAELMGGLARVFTRIVLFAIDGTSARVIETRGTSAGLEGLCIPLIDQTPLRWAIEAASPVIEAGRSPGGAALASALRLSPPRAFAVVPIIIGGRLRALAYGDRATEALPLAQVAEVFTHCDRLLRPGGNAATPPERVALRSTTARVARDEYGRPLARPKPRLERARGEVFQPEAEPLPPTKPTPAPVMETVPVQVPTPPPPSVESAVVELGAEVLPVSARPVIVTTVRPRLPAPLPPPLPAEASAEQQDATVGEHAKDPVVDVNVDETGATTTAAPAQPPTPPPPEVTLTPPCAAPTTHMLQHAMTGEVAIVTPGGVLPLTELQSRRGGAARMVFAAAAAMLIAAAGATTALLLPPRAGSGERVVTIQQHSSAPQIAQQLASAGLVRNAMAFQLLARASGADRHLRAGTYSLSLGLWPWALLDELERGQVDMRAVTIPEGLTVKEIGLALERAGLTSVEDFVRATSSRALLDTYAIAGTSVEGFLFPETYRFAAGLSAEQIAAVMVGLFFTRLSELPEARGLAGSALYERVVLASIIEREAKDESELTRIAGVFQNRLARNMRLESCATVQFIIGEPKARLSLEDVRQPSPYNTYLNEGLPPGPIANPGLAALRAAIAPEQHDLLFFVAREDGSGKHLFSSTYEEHLRAQRLARR